jgi:predicted transcriptional regulator
MRHHHVISALVSLGLSETDARVYMHLATKGPQEVGLIAEALRMQEDLLRKSLENLKDKGIVTYTSKQSTLFSALSFNNVLDLLLKEHKKETREMNRSKDYMLSKWEAMVKDDPN